MGVGNGVNHKFFKDAAFIFAWVPHDTSDTTESDKSLGFSGSPETLVSSVGECLISTVVEVIQRGSRV